MRMLAFILFVYITFVLGAAAQRYAEEYETYPAVETWADIRERAAFTGMVILVMLVLFPAFLGMWAQEYISSRR